ncbi:MAG: hypothetical protein ACYC77_02315 [Coriobacteriia bacterium]
MDEDTASAPGAKKRILAALAGHFSGECALCHLVIEKAETTDASN